jgi:hypothetical protein
MNKYLMSAASLALMLGWSGTTFAQNETDALRYTRLGISGSARIQGIGGAQTALGADISTMSSNPAGLGMFRRSEVSFSPGLQFGTTETTLNGLSSSEDRNVISIPNAGFVMSSRRDNEDRDWKGINFGINLNRLSNFNQQFSYSNTIQPPNTIVDYFAVQATGRTKADLDAEFGNFTTLEGLAYGNYLINFQDEYGRATSFANPIYSVGDISQQEEVQRKGSQNQIDIGIGTSFRDKVYLGASVGIVTTNFTQESIFRESGHYIDQFDENDVPVLEGNYSLELRDKFTTRGNGVNLRIGVIARPSDVVRIGASIQTPTAYSLSDQYQRTLYATTLDPQTGQPENTSASEIPGEFHYRLTTPFRANGGIAVFVGKYGFVTADVEYVDYGDAKFNEDDEFGSTSSSYFTNVNHNISTLYKSALNYKIGAEGRYEVFRFRAGYAVNANPYRNSSFDGKINSFTLGTGIRLQKYYLDVAYVNSTGDSLYSPYTFTDGGEPVVGIKEKQNTVMFTLGYNF